MAIKQDIIDELLSEYKKPEDPLGEEGISYALNFPCSLINRASASLISSGREK